MHIATIQAAAHGGPLSVSIKADKFPQSIAGVVWRYKPDKAPDGKAGSFSTQIPEVPLGGPGAISGKFFLIEGAVLHHNDNPPTPYQVVVSVRQGTTVLHTEVPPDSGSGQISNKNVPFVYRFVVEVS